MSRAGNKLFQIKLKEMLVRHEGFRQSPYRDSLGYLTIGVGRCLDKKGLSRLEVLFLLSNDIRECMDDLKTIPVFNELDEPRQAALVDMRFNLGGKGIRSFSKMWAALEAEDYFMAAKELLDSKYANQVGKRARTLSQMILTGEWI